MPNWCFTNINIEGNKEELSLLYKKLKEATSKNYVDNSFGTGWLGNIVESLGRSYREVSCRGTVDYMELYSDHLYIQIESAWCAHLRPFLLAMEKHAPSAQLFYVAEEEGMEEFYTNDPDYIDKYLIDVVGDWEGAPKWLAEEGRIECLETELRKILLEILGDKKNEKKTTKELIELVNHESDYCLSIHQYEYYSEYDCN